jgi:hypothetical protein
VREIDLKSVLVAGAIGAGLMVAWFYVSAPSGAAAAPFPSSTALQGFVIGAGVQIGVRMAGVS